MTHWIILSSPVWLWLLYAAISGFVLLGVTALAVAFSKQPVQRLRLIQLGLAGCLLAGPLHHLSAWPQWSLGLWERSPGGAEIAPSANPPEINPPIIVAPNHDVNAMMHALPAKSELVPRTDLDPSNRRADDPSVGSRAPHDPAPSRAPAENIAVMWPALIDGIVALYAIIAAVMAAWWLLGFLRLWRLRRHARPAPSQIMAVYREMFGTKSADVQLLVSDQIDAPLTFGWIRQVIVAPSKLCQGGDTSRLRYCLAHEWSHVQRKDIRDWYLAALVKFLFFYQPMYWWLRRQMRLCQDYLADAAANEQAASPEDYAEYLVELARGRLEPPYSAALGFADRKSHLFRRVTMLIVQKTPLRRRLGWRWNTAITLAAIGLIGAISTIRLEASGEAAPSQESAEKTEQKPAKKLENKESKPAKKQSAEPVTYKGKVSDRATGKPIEGVTVNVWTSLFSDPKTRQRSQLRQLTVKTNAQGEYSFTLTAEEVSQRSLYIEVDAHHPRYANKGRGGYAHSMIKKNLKMGAPPWFSDLKLWPGDEITGDVETPEGKPVEDVEILTYVKHTKSKRFSFDSGFFKAKTDKDGRFRITVATPGEGVLWMTPTGYVPTAHFVSTEKRGDWGRFVLTRGKRVKGNILSVKGEPVVGITIEARRRGDGVEEVDSFLGQNAVANHIGRSSVTDEKGEFSLDDLPAGTYRIRVRPDYNKMRSSPPEHVFVETSLTLSEDEDPSPLEIRAVPHVEIHAQFLDSNGKPTRGHQQHLFGRFEGGSFYFTQSNAPKPKEGKIMFRVPHGLENVQINLMNNEHGSQRWRVTPDGPLQRGRRIDLGTVEDDITGIQIVRYVAPILLVKAVDKSGKTLDDFTVKAVYGGERPKSGISFRNGGDVGFERQADARRRSSQLLPDIEVNVSVVKDGYASEPQKVTLMEGSTKELVFVLKKEDGKKGDMLSEKKADAK